MTSFADQMNARRVAREGELKLRTAKAREERMADRDANVGIPFGDGSDTNAAQAASEAASESLDAKLNRMYDLDNWRVEGERVIAFAFNPAIKKREWRDVGSTADVMSW